jgi:hypothetical protein
LHWDIDYTNEKWNKENKELVIHTSQVLR